MVLKMLFLITDILSAQYLSSEEFSLSNFQPTFNQVRSLQVYALDHVSRNVKLSFKENETFDINYSELKRFYYFRDDFVARHAISGYAYYALSSFYLSAFKILMKTFDMLDDLDVLIEFLNYNNQDDIIDLAVLLHPNPLSKRIVQYFMEDKEEISKLKRRLGDENLDELTLKMGITKSLSKKHYLIFINYFLICLRLEMYKIVERLNDILKDKGLQFLQNFLFNYSRYNSVVFYFNDNFWLKVNIKKDDLTNTEISECSEHIYIVFISKTTGQVDLEKYKNQIDFVIDIYKRGIGKELKVVCNMNRKNENRNSKRLLDFLKESYRLRIVPELPDNVNYTSLAVQLHFGIIYGLDFLGIKFEDLTLLETFNKKCIFIKIDTDEVYKKLYL